MVLIRSSCIGMDSVNSFQKYFRHRTVKNIGFLTIGNILAQIISVVGAFYIPKLLGPEYYGLFNTVTAYVSFFVIFTFSGLNKVIIRAISKNVDKSKEILEATIGMRNLFSFLAIVLSLIIVLFVNYDKGAKIYISIYSFSLLFFGLENSFNSIYQSHEKMKVLAYLSVFKQLIRVSLSIVLLLNGFGVLSIILLQLFVQIVVLLINYHFSKRLVRFNLFSKIRFNSFYIREGFYFSILELMTTLSGKIDILMLSFLTTPYNLGVYALSYRLVEKGLILRGPISQSLFPFYVKKFNKGKVNKVIIIQQALIIGIPILIGASLISLVSDLVIVGIVGEAYRQSVEIFNVLVFFLFFNYLILPFSLSMQATNNQKYFIPIGVLRAILNIVLNLLFFAKYGIIGIAYSTLIVFVFDSISKVSFSLYKLKEDGRIY